MRNKDAYQTWDEKRAEFTGNAIGLLILVAIIGVIGFIQVIMR